MHHDRIANSDLLRTLGDAFGSLSDLVHKEIRLARAELSQMLASKLQASAWAVVAAVAVFALAALGLSTQWACLAVAAILVAGGLLAFLQARRLAQSGPAPQRVLGQVARDIQTVKELIT